MKLTLNLPSDGFSSTQLKSRNSDRLLLSNEKSFASSDPFDSVRERLSSTRHLLEQTLNNKKTAGFPCYDENHLHKELKKPGFKQLSHIYENYMKVFIEQKKQLKTTSTKRPSSAPPVWQKTKEQLLIEKEEKFKQECTFKPKINPIPTTKNLDYKPKKFDRDEWFKNLSRPRTETIEQRERQKREKEEEDNKNNSFRPSISSFHSTRSSQLRVEERLLSHQNKIIKREQLKREKDELEASAFPYSPQVSDSVAVLIDYRKTQPPLYKRVLEVQQENLNLKKLARENNEKHENNTFKPFISPNSRKLAASKCFGDVTERLSRDPSHYKEKLSESSVSFTSTSSKPYSAKEFLSRQQNLYEKSQQRKVRNIQSLLVSSSTLNLSFKPEINSNSNLIASYKHNYSEESLDQKILRISDKALERKNNLKEKIKADYYNQFKYEPEINPLSRQLGQTTNLSNSQEESRAKKKLKAQASVAELEKLCSFSPRINSPKRLSSVNSSYRQGENILEKIENSRKEKIAMISNMKTAEELEKNKLCTFKPQTLPRIQSDSNIQVKGIDRFHELRGMAKKQQVDKEQREKKLLYRGVTRDLIYSPYS